MTCKYCAKDLNVCLKHFEVSAYLDTHLIKTHVEDLTTNNINNAINWAEKLGADFIEVYQGCDRENQILTLNLKNLQIA